MKIVAKIPHQKWRDEIGENISCSTKMEWDGNVDFVEKIIYSRTITWITWKCPDCGESIIAPAGARELTDINS